MKKIEKLNNEIKFTILTKEEVESDRSSAYEYLIGNPKKIENDPYFDKGLEYLANIKESKTILIENLKEDLNQCDGCKAGYPVNEFNIHVMPYPSGNMVCQKNKYKTRKDKESNIKVDLKAILDKKLELSGLPILYGKEGIMYLTILEAMKEACDKVVDLAAGNANIYISHQFGEIEYWHESMKEYTNNLSQSWRDVLEVDKDSILKTKDQIS